MACSTLHISSLCVRRIRSLLERSAIQAIPRVELAAKVSPVEVVVFRRTRRSRQRGLLGIAVVGMTR